MGVHLLWISPVLLLRNCARKVSSANLGLCNPSLSYAVFVAPALVIKQPAPYQNVAFHIEV